MTAQPVYLLAGGRGHSPTKQLTLLKAVFDGFGIPKPSIAYTGTASGDDRSFFAFITASFKLAGAGKVSHAVIAPDKADLKKARNILESADIVFVSGGDVEAGMEILREKQMLGFLDNLYQQGKPFFGVSAGAIMLAKQWVRWPDPDDDTSAELFPCLGYAPVICDTHDEQAGWEELQAALLLENEGVKGYGLSSGSGIKVAPDGAVSSIGGTVFRYIKRSNNVHRLEDLVA